MKLPVPMSLAQIAQSIGGKLQGPGDLTVTCFAPSPLHAKEDELTLIFDQKLLKKLDQVKAKAVIVPVGAQTQRTAIFVERPNLALQKILTAVQPKRYFPESGIHPTAVIDPSCEIDQDVAIGACVVIGPRCKIGKRTKIMPGTVIGGEVSVGEDCLFHPGCMIADYVKVGNRVILQQGVSLGSDGFGYVTERPSNLELRMDGNKELSQESNPLLKIPQIGTVIIEDDVEIGANTTIDRATVGATVIGRGTKIDNLVMVAHNCTIGKDVILVSQVGVAGSCVIGDRAILAGQAGIKDHITIGKDAIIEGKAGVMKDVSEGDMQIGSPAVGAREFMVDVALAKKLPKLFSDFKALQKKVSELEASKSKPAGVNANGSNS